MAIQREEFKRLGVFGEWDTPYLTLDKSYEATIVREFGQFVRAGSVYKGFKPVHWCASCGTALAEAEVEYMDHTSPSIYVGFKVIEGLPEALSLVIEMESSKLDSVFDGIVAATDSEFVRRMRAFQDAGTNHINYICRQIVQLEPTLAESCHALKIAHG